MTAKNTLQTLIDQTKETAVLQSIEELLNWDQRTQMPARAANYRAEQITLLSGMIHQRTVDPKRGQYLTELAEEASSQSDHDGDVIVLRLLKQYEKEKKIPLRLVEEFSKARVMAHQAWVDARKANRFSDFAPHLETIVKLLREKTDAIGFQESAYDVLLDDYEPDTKSSDVGSVFSALKADLVPLISEIGESSCRPDSSIIRSPFPIADQQTFGTSAAKAIGFDFEAGRLDITHHPFCCTVGPKDCRITTRYDKNYFNSAFFGILHEAGHGLYEQGLRADQFGLPTGEYCSLGIHESQSRLWENMVGRSKSFWKHFFPLAQNSFPKALANVPLDHFFGAVNDVKPSLIRVEADEATYSLHVIIRFELEQALFTGDLQVNDLPAAWNQKYQQALGIHPDSDSNGVLQDVHWSEGLFGYFPTYALGNLYAAQFFDSAAKAIGDLDLQISKGEFVPLLNWLRSNVHQKGKSLSASGILQSATGESLSHQPMMTYLREKYAEIYSL